MSNTPNPTPAEVAAPDRVMHDSLFGNYRLVITDTGDSESYAVAITKDGQMVRSFEVLRYKMYNVVAHMWDFIDEMEERS